MLDLSERGIRMQTRKGNDIDNGQLRAISSFESFQFRDYKSKYESHVTFRSRPTGIYNCHGLTFGGRRTGIYEAEVQKILRDDDYREIDIAHVLPGDIIVYFLLDGDIWHSGVVVSAPDSQLQIPLVVSKWGKYKEAIHWANNCPYDFSRVKYYRIQE